MDQTMLQNSQTLRGNRLDIKEHHGKKLSSNLDVENHKVDIDGSGTRYATNYSFGPFKWV